MMHRTVLFQLEARRSRTPSNETLRGQRDGGGRADLDRRTGGAQVDSRPGPEVLAEPYLDGFLWRGQRSNRQVRVELRFQSRLQLHILHLVLKQSRTGGHFDMNIKKEKSGVLVCRGGRTRTRLEPEPDSNQNPNQTRTRTRTEPD